MQLTMKSLHLRFSQKYETEYHSSACDDAALLSWDRLPGEPFCPSKNTVFITDRMEHVRKREQPLEGNLICVGFSGEDKDAVLKLWKGAVLFIHTDHINEVIGEVRLLCETENLKSRLSMALMEALTEGKGAQGLADAAYSYLRNPLVIFNGAYRIVGMTGDALHAQESEVTDLLLENGGFSTSDYAFANRDALHSRVKKSKDPILAFHEGLQINQLLVSVNAERDYGHIVVNEFEHPFSEKDTELLLILRNYVNLQMRQEELQNRNGNHASEHFILDLLDETIVVTGSYQAFIQQLDYTFPKYMRCLLISTELTPGAVNTLSIQNQINYLFPGSKVVVYEKKIVGLIPVPGNGKIQEAIAESFRGFCQKNKLYAAISNSFDNVMDLRLFFKQALRAMEAGRSVQDVPGLYLYEDYYLVHLKNLFLQKEPLDVFLCPALKHLTAYDRKHHTELARTLFLYLLNDRNLVQTAKAMQMHRSSLLYRFDKITELLGEIPESIMERQYYILSYQFSNGALPL